MPVPSPVRRPVTYPASRMGAAIATGMLPEPALSWEFARGEAMGALAVTRSGATATFVDGTGVRRTAAANSARYDHDPATGRLLGLLREPQRTNLALYSDDASNANWFKEGSVTVTGTARIVETAGTSAHGLTQAPTLAGSTAYVMSADLLPLGRRYVQAILYPGGGSHVWATFDLEDGVVVEGSTSVVAGMRRAEGGRWRCWVRGTSAAVPSSPYVSWLSATASGGLAPSIAGLDGDAFEIRAIQVEAGHCTTSPIATTSASVQRNADAILLSGVPFTGAWNAAEGSALVEWSMLDAPAGSAFPPLLSFNDGGGNERLNLFLSEASGGFFLGCVDGGAAQVTGMTVPGVAYDGTPQRMAGGWRLNTIRMAAMGTLSALDTSATIPTVTQMQVGDQASALGPASTPIWFRRVHYWPRRLSDEQLRLLSAA